MTTLMVPLGELTDVVSGGTPSRSDPSLFGGDIPWVKIGDMLQGTIRRTDETISEAGLRGSSAKLLPAGTLLLSIFATIGRTAVLEVEATTNQAIAGLSIREPSRLDRNYLRRYLEFTSDALASQGRGVAQANINLSILRSHLVPVLPIEEQRRIASILDAADALRTKRRQALAKLETLSQAIFIDMFGWMVGDPTLWSQLAELVPPGDRINYGVVQPGTDAIEGVPMIRVGDLVDGRVNHLAVKRISADIDAQYSRSRLVGDEILLSCVGSAGVVALASPREQGWNIARAVARIPLQKSIERDYVAAFLSSPIAQRYFDNELRTVSQPTLNIKQIKELPVPIPSASDQAAFAGLAQRVRLAQDFQRASLDRLDALFASLQHRAFRGEL